MILIKKALVGSNSLFILISFIIIMNGQSLRSQRFDAGTDHSILICPEGTSVGSGANDQGQMCNPNYNPANISPQELVTGSWEMIACGYKHTLLLNSNGTLWASGNNDQGELGIGNLPDQNVPVQVGEDTNWTFIAATQNVSYGIKSDGTLWAWGTSLAGHFGPTIAQTFEPVQVGLSDKWISVSTNINHTLGLQQGNTLWGWGQNSNGELGNNTTIAEYSPIQIGADKGWIDVEAGGSHSLALDSEGKLWGTGNNVVGQLGLGQEISFRSLWVEINSDDIWKEIAAGGAFSAAIKDDGTLWTFGNNISGELGIGTTAKAVFPNQVGTDTDWVDIAAGDFHMIGIKESGDVYSWGHNNSGQLGVVSCNGTTFCTEPQAVSMPCGSITSINHNETSPEFKFYPNPTHSILTIETNSSGLYSMDIHSLNGQLLYSNKMEGPTNKIDLSSFHKGVYFITIRSKDYISTQKIFML